MSIKHALYGEIIECLYSCLTDRSEIESPSSNMTQFEKKVNYHHILCAPKYFTLKWQLGKEQKNHIKI